MFNVMRQVRRLNILVKYVPKFEYNLGLYYGRSQNALASNMHKLRTIQTCSYIYVLHELII